MLNLNPLKNLKKHFLASSQDATRGAAKSIFSKCAEVSAKLKECRKSKEVYRTTTEDILAQMAEIVKKHGSMPLEFVEEPEESKMKMWYELPENIGQIVKVRDDKHQRWYYGVFEGLGTSTHYPYKCNGHNWVYAELVDFNEVLLKGKL